MPAIVMARGKPQEIASRWLAAAQGDLVLARAAARDREAPARGTAFFTHQAVEKALKAVLSFEQAEFPRTHDLAALAELVPPSWGLDLPSEELDRLTDFAVDTRYPIEDESFVRPVTADEAQSALLSVANILRRIIDGFSERGMKPPLKPE